MSVIRRGLLDDALDCLKRQLDRLDESTRQALKVGDLAGEILILKSTMLNLGQIVVALYDERKEALNK